MNSNFNCTCSRYQVRGDIFSIRLCQIHYCPYNIITGVYQESFFTDMTDHILVYYSKIISMDVSNEGRKKIPSGSDQPMSSLTSCSQMLIDKTFHKNGKVYIIWFVIYITQQKLFISKCLHYVGNPGKQEFGNFFYVFLTSTAW